MRVFSYQSSIVWFIQQKYDLIKEQTKVYFTSVESCRGHHYAILIRVHVVARLDRNASHDDIDVAFPFVALRALERVCVARLDADVRLLERTRVAHAPVDDYAFPSVRSTLCRKHVTKQRASHGTTSVDDEHLSLPIFLRECLSHERVIFEALDGSCGSHELDPSSVVPESGCNASDLFAFSDDVDGVRHMFVREVARRGYVREIVRWRNGKS